MADARQRWDTDERFTGVADASALAPGVDELAALTRRPGWVAEDPDAHLGPQLRDAAVAGLRIVAVGPGPDGILLVTAECEPGTRPRQLRQRAWTLLGTVAEPAASVRERRDQDATVFDVVTGVPDNTGPFAGHGHTLRLTVRPAAPAPSAS